MSKQLNALVFDVETAPILAYVWDTKEQNIALNQIVEDWRLLAFSAKWLGAKQVVYREARTREAELPLLRDLWDLLDRADIVITQNGKDFDSRKVNARFIEHGMKPPSPYKHIDTYLIASRVAKFTSNKLEYLTAKLNKKFKKLSHKRFPGQVLWNECLKGNPAAWAEMKRYNIHDVLSTEELFHYLKAWAPESMPKVFDVTNKARECSTCGHVGPMREGKLRRAKTYKYRQHSCLKCGAWQSGEKI